MRKVTGPYREPVTLELLQTISLNQSQNRCLNLSQSLNQCPNLSLNLRKSLRFLNLLQFLLNI